MGEDLQRSHDDRSGDRPAGPSQHHLGTESSQLPYGSGQEISRDGGDPCSRAVTFSDLRLLQPLPTASVIGFPTPSMAHCRTAEEQKTDPWWKSGPVPIVVYKRSWRETFPDGGTKKEKKKQKKKEAKEGEACGKCRS